MSNKSMQHLGVFFEGKEVLVTGGFGFVGSHLVKKLLALNCKVTVLDIDTSERRNSLLNEEGEGLRHRIHIETGDVADFGFLQKVIEKSRFELVFHLAAYASVIEKAVSNPYDTIQANTIGLVNLLEAIRRANYTPEMVFFSSTDKVYGEMDGEPYQEANTPLRGIGVYDSAKLAADVFARTYNEVFEIPTVVLRMCNLFGPFDFNTDFRLIPRAMKRIYGNDFPQPPELYFEALEHWREYLYIEDAVQAILLLASNPQCKGEVYNLLGCTYISTPDMLKTLVEVVIETEEENHHKSVGLIRQNGITMTVKSENKQIIAIKKQRLNGEKIRKAVEFEPVFDCREALKQTVRFYKDFFSKKNTPAEAKKHIAYE